MQEAQVRGKIVSIMRDWIGRKESDGSHRLIVDTYNSLSPLPRGYKLTYKDAWCAATVSAAAIEAGYTDIIPRECSCSYMIAAFQRRGRWIENDAYRPAPGDLIFYDWQDSGKGDNAGAPDHVGMVERVDGDRITVIEGNNADAVKRRTLAVNGRYIRGYAVPDYASLASPDTDTSARTIGSDIRFVGTRQYDSSYDTARASTAQPCDAKITAIREGRAHPCHIEGPTVEGWVDAADVQDPTGYQVRVLVSTFLAVRTGPGTGNPIKTQLRNGDLVTVLERRGNWGRISTGWICLDYAQEVST